MVWTLPNTRKAFSQRRGTLFQIPPRVGRATKISNRLELYRYFRCSFFLSHWDMESQRLRIFQIGMKLGLNGKFNILKLDIENDSPNRSK